MSFLSWVSGQALTVSGRLVDRSSREYISLYEYERDILVSDLHYLRVEMRDFTHAYLDCLLSLLNRPG
jgi:hypothetical protein